MALFRAQSALQRAQGSSDPDAKLRAIEEAISILIRMLEEEDRGV